MPQDRRCVLDRRQGSGGGAVVNISSIYGLAGKAAHHAYAASKHAVIALSSRAIRPTRCRCVRE
jgi:NAD(P)-dependent dehydrogenase (short-subunit alcohol dehydrogenase family)